ncbi:hypothetical protein MTYM_01603 [Methylococcales bacterium]|nr:hypothetical protein MTYM_01603 [Methylococcales bacterium]
MGYHKNELKTNDREDVRAKLVQPILGYVGFSYAWHEETGCLLLYSDHSQSDVVGVCLVRALNEKLECTDKGMNFAQQTVRAMRNQQVCWGILTNGSRWRLYRLGGPAPIEAFLEADLATIVAENAMPDYIVFQRFFSGPSFARTGGNQLRINLYLGLCPIHRGLGWSNIARVTKHKATTTFSILQRPSSSDYQTGMGVYYWHAIA